MKLYKADRETGEYLSGSDSLAFENPQYRTGTHEESDRWLYNDRTSSLISPPCVNDNEVAVLEGKQWVVRPDFRGVRYWLGDGTEYHIISIGCDLPSGCITTPPPSIWHKTHDGHGWIEDIDGKLEHQMEAVSRKRYELYTDEKGTDAALIEYLRDKFKDDPVVSEINIRVAKIKTDNPKL